MIKDRIIQILEYKRIAKEDFYVKIGMTSASFRGKAKNSPLNSLAIENILSEIPEINTEWLLTGKGEMLKTSTPKSEPIATDNETRLWNMLESQQQTIRELSKSLEKAQQTINELTKSNGL